MNGEVFIGVGLGVLRVCGAISAAIIKMVNPSSRYVRMEVCEAMREPLARRLEKMEMKVDKNAEIMGAKLDLLTKSMAEVRAILRQMSNGCALSSTDED